MSKSQKTEMDSNDSWKQHSARFCANKSLVRAQFQHCSDHGNAFVCRNIIFHPSSLNWSPDYDLSRHRIVEKLANACRATADEDALPFPQQEKSRKYRQGFQRARQWKLISASSPRNRAFSRQFHIGKVRKNFLSKNNIYLISVTLILNFYINYSLFRFGIFIILNSIS